MNKYKTECNGEAVVLIALADILKTLEDTRPVSITHVEEILMMLVPTYDLRVSSAFLPYPDDVEYYATVNVFTEHNPTKIYTQDNLKHMGMYNVEVKWDPTEKYFTPVSIVFNRGA